MKLHRWTEQHRWTEAQQRPARLSAQGVSAEAPVEPPVEAPVEEPGEVPGGALVESKDSRVIIHWISMVFSSDINGICMGYEWDV